MTTKPKYTHILEIKEGGGKEPNQYRITVVEDNVSTLLQLHLNKPDDDGFKILGYYPTHEELVAVLEPHLAMEASK
jgi:hypothetical protein